MKSSTKYLIGILVGIFLLTAVIVWAQSCYQKKVVTSYASSIQLIQEGKYKDAVAKIKRANARNDVDLDIKNASLYGFEPENEYYKDSWEICLYAMAMQAYSEEKSALSIQQYLGRISSDYNGEFKKEIDELRTTVVSLEAEREKYIAEHEPELLQELKNKIPYECMDEKYINSTLVGTADEHNQETIKSTDFHKDEYIWYADNNTDIVLVVECINGMVTDVKKHNTSLYWTSDGKPNFGATRKKTYVPVVEDYNVAEYSDPEDFYYDNDENFGDYDSAREFYMEFHP